MLKNKHLNLTFLASLLLSLAILPVQADELEPDQYVTPTEIYLAQSNQQDDSKEEVVQQPRSGTILLPNSLNQRNNQDTKKCMTVCTKWGQDCIIDPNRGRKCRRTCKEFGEECF
jgi:hypothetical protein